jgi:hypothetical protein
MILFIKLIAIKNGSTIRLMIISVFIWIIIRDWLIRDLNWIERN